MKIRAINVFEYILFIVFIAGIFLQGGHTLLLSWIIFISGMFLGCLYWPLGFYTLKLPGVNIKYAVAASLLFSCSIVIVIFKVLKWPNPPFTFEILTGIYGVVFLAMSGIYVFTKNKAQPVKFSRSLLARFAAYFLLVLYALFAYKSSR